MDTMVSICCLTYNHEKYISDALDSFLMQTSSYPFEILIHDDASTDRTAEIIKSYEKDNPGVIKPIYQTENQHSRGVHISATFVIPKVKGKYIALCEGDDYWTDPLKLQKQVRYMQSNPKCSLCTHAARIISRNKKIEGHIRPATSDKQFTTDDVIIGGGGMFATNSMLFPTKLVKTLPDFYYNSPVGDYPLAIYLSLQGEVHYIDQYMSNYRAMVENSWSSTVMTDKSKRSELNRKIEMMLNEMNVYTDYKYTSAINKFLLDHELEREFSQLLFEFDIRKIKSEKHIAKYEALSLKQKGRLYVGAYLPFIVSLSRKIRKIT